ncbi:hypothetical protein SLS57_011051 [Botryosphaeria dothidea]
MATTCSHSASEYPPQSRQARLTITEAITRLQQSISSDDALLFESTSLADVRQAAVEVEAKLAASQSLRSMRRIESFLNGIEHYSKVVEVVCNGTPYLPWIWGLLRANYAHRKISKLSSDYLSSFEKLIDAYAQIAETFPRFDWLSTTFKNETRFQELLAQHADLIDREANAIDIAEAKSMRERLNDELSRRETADALVFLSSAISWLNLTGIPQQEDELDRLLGRRHPSSCDWLLDNPKIEKWKGNDQAQKLAWVFGKPGAAQAIGLNEEVIPYIIDNYACKTSAASAKELRTLLPHVLSNSPSGRIVLDGLDECDVDQQQLILRDVLAITQNAGPDWKVLIFSREIPTITQQLSNFSLKTRISLSEENHSINRAIGGFVDQKLQNLPQDTPNLQGRADLLKNKLNTKSNGMFLWVHLVLKSLEYTNSLEILEEAIDILPSDLTELYERLLNDVQNRLPIHIFRKAICMLRLIMHSYRSLKRAEVLDALVLKDKIIDDSSKLYAEVMDICKPLVEIGPEDTVVLVHFSLRECAAASEAFHTEYARDEHEKLVHMKRLPCQSPQRPPSLVQEQFDTLNSQQQAPYCQKMLQVAQAQGNKQHQLKRQFTTMMHEIMKANNLDDRPSVDVSPEVRAQLSAEIQKSMQYINNLDQIMYVDWLTHRGNQRAETIITTRHILYSQLEPQTKKLKEHLTIHPSLIHVMLDQIIGYIKSVIAGHQSEKAQPRPDGQKGL